METAIQAANSALSSKSNTPSVIAAPPKSHPLSTDSLDYVWLRMASRYGHAWVSQYGPKPDGFGGSEWRTTLAGISDAQIKLGFAVDARRGADWPPSSTSFRTMCFDVPQIATVRAELAARHTQRSPFANLVWAHIDAHRYRLADAERGDRMLREAYDLAREHVIRGGALPETLVEIAAPEPEARTPASAETAEVSMETLRRRLYGVEDAA